MKKIYLDHSATTPLDTKVLKAMMPFLKNKFGNPASIHSFGREAVEAVDEARENVAGVLNCEPDEVIFTSGATESNNLAIKGLIKALNTGNNNIHMITSKIEHSAVLEPFLELEKEGVSASYIGVDSRGVIDIEALRKEIREETVLVSVMYVNNEVGIMEPIREIGKIIFKINERREKDWKNKKPSERGERPRPIYFHVDATQALNFFNCDVAWNYIDMLSLSGHKIYGPKGVGALYVKSSIKLKPIQIGGHQEKNLRSGTLNVPGIVGLGEAIKLLKTKEHEKANIKIKRLRDMLVKGLTSKIPNIILNTDRENSAPSHAHFSFLGAEGESMLISLDLAGIAVSTGSACASGSLEPSHVLLAMGIKKEVSHHSIRFTIGKGNTEDEIKRVIKVLPPIINRLRVIAPEY